MAYCCTGHHVNSDDALWCTACGSLVEGAMIGDYRLVSYVGNGSAADVYLAEQSSLSKRRVVIKIMHRSWSASRIGHFEREAAVLAALSHPYILPIFSYGVLYKRPAQEEEQAAQDNHKVPPSTPQGPLSLQCLPYLVLPYAEQGSLAEIFEREGKHPWSLERVVTIAKEVGEALDYAHARGVIHRDIKPANILYMGSHALLCDFSVASPIDADVSHLNAPWAGSPAYMAPEVWQLHPGRYSDQYALAVSCFYLLTGQLPLSKSGGTGTRSWSNAHCFIAPRSIRELRSDLPLAIDPVLQRALSKDPHDRYTTVGAFASDLFFASQDITQEIGSFPHGKRNSNTKGPSQFNGIAANRPESIRPTPAPIRPANDGGAIHQAPAAEHKANARAIHLDPKPGQKEPAVEARFIAPAPAVQPGVHEAVKGEERPAPIRPANDVGTINRAPTPVTAPVSPITPVTEPKGFISDVNTEAIHSVKYNDRWGWYGLLLNFLVCLAIAVEYGWQVGNVTAAASMLLVVWPALLVGPLLARFFRRVVFTTLSWGLFWGVFYGLSNALLSILACLLWTLLALFPSYYACPSWCHPGDGFSVVSNVVFTLAQQAVLPVVLGLWIAVIGGAIIGIVHIRYQDA